MSRPSTPCHRVLLSIAVASVSACTSYPDDFAPVDRSLLSGFTGRCADIRGTYGLRGRETRQNRGTFGQTFLRTLIDARNPRWPWERITIAGNAADSLVLTVSRSDSTIATWRDFAFDNGDYGQRQWVTLQNPAVRWQGSFASMSDSAYAENLDKLTLRREKTTVAHRGVDYECGGGWVRSARTVHDPGPFPDTPRPDTVNGEILLARADDGSLVAKAVYREEVTISLWCGDGCRGASLGTWTMRHWARWGASTPFTRVPDARPWAGPRPSAAVPEVSESRRSLTEIIAQVRSHAPDGLTITDVRLDGQIVRVHVAVRTRAVASQFLRALANDGSLAMPELLEMRTSPDGSAEATIRVRGR